MAPELVGNDGERAEARSRSPDDRRVVKESQAGF
jgi:hypothetical protein